MVERKCEKEREDNGGAILCTKIHTHTYTYVYTHPVTRLIDTHPYAYTNK